MQTQTTYHETVEVHDMSGKLRNLLQQKSIGRGYQVRGKDWQYSHGWTHRETGVQYDLYVRPVYAATREP